MKETLGDKTENVATRTPAVVEKAPMKKKVRVVKKIVKKKVIKKVPKRLPVASNCNDIEKSSSSNPNDYAPMETEKSNSVVDDLRESEDVKEFEVSDRNDLVSASLLGDQNRIESPHFEHDINTMDVEDHEGDKGVMELVVNNETDDLKSQQGLSGEMVNSGLHMKQRTKIFIQGLGEEAKEEDIRKVFEDVGEVVEVKVITNHRTGKSRGFGFISYASADHANLALTKYHNVEICGRLCHTAAVENDAIVLNNIDKKWNNVYIVELLQKIGIKKIDEVSVVADPENTELNCGLAFLEFVTKRDAQIAYRKLQAEDVFGKQSNIKVSWAEPLTKPLVEPLTEPLTKPLTEPLTEPLPDPLAEPLAEPVEEESHNIKSVYAERIPSSWDEKEVIDQFKIYGEIESIALAKNLRSTKRNDFAFINYKTCEAALSCVETLTSKKSTNNNGPKARLKVSLAKSIPKGKPMKTVSDSRVTEVSKTNKPNANQTRPFQTRYQTPTQSKPSQESLSFLRVYNKPQQPPENMKVLTIGRQQGSRKDSSRSIQEGSRKDGGGSSTTAELVQLLREQASWKQGGPSLTTGHHQPPPGGKQPFTELGSRSSYHDPRAYHQTHLQIPNAHPRSTTYMPSFPDYDQQRAHYASGSFNAVQANPRYFQTRDQTTYPGSGSSSIYRQMY